MKALSAGKEGYVPADGTVLAVSKVEMKDGDSVFDVLKRACDLADIQLEYSYTPIYESYYVEGIHQIYEFDCGSESGWMISFNNWFMDQGASAEITGLSFLEDYGTLAPEFDTDTISVFVNITGDANADAAYVAEAERFIDAIDQAGDAKAEAVTVARTIYDHLSDTQKTLVTNYAKLEEAEKGDDGDEDLKPTPTDITAVYQATGNYLENFAKTTAPAVSSVGLSDHRTVRKASI